MVRVETWLLLPLGRPNFRVNSESGNRPAEVMSFSFLFRGNSAMSEAVRRALQTTIIAGAWLCCLGPSRTFADPTTSISEIGSLYEAVVEAGAQPSADKLNIVIPAMLYDLDSLDTEGEPPSQRVENTSPRDAIDTGNGPLIGGLILRGEGPENVLIQALGPDLAALQVPNALQDPTLEVRDAWGDLLASNDNWRDEQGEEIAATGLAPDDNRDSAVCVCLVPGSYTAIVRAKAESTGAGLVEVYDLKSD
jgi:hypothetical protein